MTLTPPRLYNVEVWTLVDAYITRLFLGFFMAGLLVFVTLFAAADAMGLLMSFEGLETGPLLRYYAYFLPEIVHQMVPMACLVATVMTLAVLQRNNEMVALYASGLGLMRICQPVLILIVLISSLSFWAADRLLPGFAAQKNYVYYVELRDRPGALSTLQMDKMWFRSKNTIFNFQRVVPEESRAHGLSLYYFSEDWDLIQMITAKRIRFDRRQWQLEEGSVTLFTEDSSFPLTTPFQTKTIVMDEDAADLELSARPSEMLSLRELRGYIQRTREAGLDTLRFEVDYHSKFSYAFAGLIMSLLGIAFSVGTSRSSSILRSLSVCLLLVFVYWIFYSAFITIGRYGGLTPLMAAWIPNVVMGLAATFLIHRLKL